jgi:hypothetical protein
MSNQTRSPDKQVFSSPEQRQEKDYQTLGKGAAWTIYAFLGFWLRLSAFVLFYVGGVALTAGFPAAVLERIGIIPWRVLNIPWLTEQSTLVYLIAAAIVTIGGILWLAVGYSFRRWIFSHP